MIVQPFRYFGGACEEAMKFYASVLGAELGSMMHYRDMPRSGGGGPPQEMPAGDQIMYSQLDVDGTRLMAADGCTRGEQMSGFAMAVTVKDKAEADRVFNQLSAGGKIKMPLTETFFSPHFGQLTDRFGLQWMVLVQPTTQV